MIKNHPYPGEILRDEVIEASGLTVTEAAQRLHITRAALSRVLNGKAGISADLAIRLEKADISTARMWISLQASYDLWKALQREQPSIQKFIA